MPNYCQNILIVNGSQELIEGLMRHITGDEGNFDFNTIIPYPEHFRKMDEACREADRSGTRNHNIKDGYNSGGYEWCKEKWGTKWNAGTAEVFKSHAGTMFVFKTAWSPPIPVVEELARRFPALSIELLYFEKGMQKAGSWSRVPDQEYEEREKDIPQVPDHSKWDNYGGLLGG